MNDSLFDSVVARASRASVKTLALASVAFASVIFVPASAAAKREFPAQLAKAANMPCVPQCTVCHVVNPGEAGTATKPFAGAMIRYGVLSDGAGKAFEALKADNKPEYQAFVQAIEDGLDPNYPKQLACGPSYGCGAHVAKKPPRDYWGIGWVVGALSAYALTRRLKSRAAPRL